MNVLEVKDLYKSFGKTEVLKGVNFTLERGEVLTIIGSSGSGKTTLLRCLNFLERADKGQIIVNDDVVFDAGEPEPKASVTRIKQLSFGLVFQSFNLFPQYNVLENVMLAPLLLAKEDKNYKKHRKEVHAEIEQNAKRLIARVGLAEKESSYPCQLSGGQQQRVAIARALAMKPEILCFDEPTSALDPELTGEVLKVIRGLKSSDSTMIVVTHEMEFARSVADKVIFMADGIIEECGTPEEVFDHPKSPKTQAFLNKISEI